MTFRKGTQKSRDKSEKKAELHCVNSKSIIVQKLKFSFLLLHCNEDEGVLTHVRK